MKKLLAKYIKSQRIQCENIKTLVYRSWIAKSNEFNENDVQIDILLRDLKIKDRARENDGEYL
jgi:hypothetical protein